MQAEKRDRVQFLGKKLSQNRVFLLKFGSKGQHIWFSLYQELNCCGSVWSKFNFAVGTNAAFLPQFFLRLCLKNFFIFCRVLDYFEYIELCDQILEKTHIVTKQSVLISLWPQTFASSIFRICSKAAAILWYQHHVWYFAMITIMFWFI